MHCSTAHTYSCKIQKARLKSSEGSAAGGPPFPPRPHVGAGARHGGEEQGAQWVGLQAVGARAVGPDAVLAGALRLAQALADGGAGALCRDHPAAARRGGERRGARAVPPRSGNWWREAGTGQQCGRPAAAPTDLLVGMLSVTHAHSPPLVERAPGGGLKVLGMDSRDRAAVLSTMMRFGLHVSHGRRVGEGGWGLRHCAAWACGDWALLWTPACAGRWADALVGQQWRVRRRLGVVTAWLAAAPAVPCHAVLCHGHGALGAGARAVGTPRVGPCLLTPSEA